jgi:hypothetical protein
MERLFRSDYLGEFVVHINNRVRGRVEQVREWVPNTIIQAHTGRALVVGNGISRLQNPINFELFTSHKGGLHGSMKLSVYGCNALYRDAKPHFLVATHPLIAKEIAESGYAENSIVLTNQKNVMSHPDLFHLIPFNPNFDAGATALYLAAFDKHNHVYFTGFDGQDSPSFNNNVYAGTNGYPAPTAHVDSGRWAENCKVVFDTYHTTEFIRVMPGGGETMPEPWKYCPNVRQISFRQFISEADIGVT